jgi:hypothetical protein
MKTLARRDDKRVGVFCDGRDGGGRVRVASVLSFPGHFH